MAAGDIVRLALDSRFQKGVRVENVDAHKRGGVPVSAYVRVKTSGGKSANFDLGELKQALSGDDTPESAAVREKIDAGKSLDEADLRVVARAAERGGKSAPSPRKSAPSPPGEFEKGDEVWFEGGQELTPGEMEANHGKVVRVNDDGTLNVEVPGPEGVGRETVKGVNPADLSADPWGDGLEGDYPSGPRPKRVTTPANREKAAVDKMFKDQKPGEALTFDVVGEDIEPLYVGKLGEDDYVIEGYGDADGADEEGAKEYVTDLLQEIAEDREVTATDEEIEDPDWDSLDGVKLKISLDRDEMLDEL